MSFDAGRIARALPIGDGPGLVPANARGVLLAMAALMRQPRTGEPWQPDRHGVCTATDHTLAADTGLSERTVRRRVAALRDAGVITVQRRAGPHYRAGGVSHIIRIRAYRGDQPATVAGWSGTACHDPAACQPANERPTNRPPWPDQPATLADYHHQMTQHDNALRTSESVAARVPTRGQTVTGILDAASAAQLEREVCEAGKGPLTTWLAAQIARVGERPFLGILRRTMAVIADEGQGGGPRSNLRAYIEQAIANEEARKSQTGPSLGAARLAGIRGEVAARPTQTAATEHAARPTRHSLELLRLLSERQS